MAVRPVGHSTVVLGIGLTLPLCLAALVLTQVPGPGGHRLPLSEVVWFSSFFLFPLVGAVILWHRPGNLVGWIFLAVGLTQSLAAVAGGGGELLRAGDPTSWWGAELWVWENVFFAIAFVLATTYPLLLFPDGRLPSRRWRPVVHATSVGLAVLVVGILVTPGRIESDVELVNPLGISALGGVPLVVLNTALIFLLGVAALGLFSLVARWHGGEPETRRRLSWLVLAVLVVVAVNVAGAVAGPWLPDWAGSIEEAVTIAALPVATGVAVLRSDLFDVTSVLDRTLVYLVLTALVVPTFVATVAAATSLLGSEAGRGASLLAAAVVAVLVSPVKERLQRGVDRFLYGDRARPYTVLSGLAAKLEQTSGSDDLLDTVTTAIAESLRVPYVRVLVGEPVLVPSDSVALPLLSHGWQEGVLLVGLRSDGRGFDARELELLGNLARQVAVEARGMRLAEDVRESRERIVRAREQERLRVRRDLHDGIGPTLAAASLQVDALRERWPVQDPQAAHLMGQMKSEIAQCVLDIRRVIEGLRPPALDDLGLAGVVREHAASLTAAGLVVDVECPHDLLVPSAAVEVAAYRIVTEAMTNVIRHANATRCSVALQSVDGWLHVDVRDDGVGLGPVHRDGIGLTSMRERAAELGGAVNIATRSDGGATVTASLPLPDVVPV
jgi:signal transduction histidine kinase